MNACLKPKKIFPPLPIDRWGRCVDHVMEENAKKNRQRQQQQQHPGRKDERQKKTIDSRNIKKCGAHSVHWTALHTRSQSPRFLRAFRSPSPSTPPLSLSFSLSLSLSPHLLPYSPTWLPAASSLSPSHSDSLRAALHPSFRSSTRFQSGIGHQPPQPTTISAPDTGTFFGEPRHQCPTRKGKIPDIIYATTATGS